MGALSVQGTTSWAGKSLLTTALCRLFARRDVTVAPFKAQNMSNNARVVAGGEIGVAQYLQARAARVEPDVRMNPVLVKPEADTQSQVVLHGSVDYELTALPWRERGPRLWQAAEGSLHELLASFDVVVLEGAGSPAEINLMGTDLANMRSARSAGAPVLLVTDIDRGGAFAHLYGTWALLDPADRARLAGFVLNRFRGDAGLLAPGPQLLEGMTGVPVLGVVPLFAHGLPDEDGAAQPTGEVGRRVAVVRYPTASNLDEFKLLEHASQLRYATTTAELRDADLVVLPGSKHVGPDLAWLRATGIASALQERAAVGLPVLGICGGLMMLGDRLLADAGIDCASDGLGLLPVETTFEREKIVRHRRSVFVRELVGPWQGLAGVEVGGYEIRHGRVSAPRDGASAALPDGLGWVRGAVLGIAIHGALESPDVVEALVGRRPQWSLDAELDRLADAVEPHLPVDRLLELALAAKRP